MNRYLVSIRNHLYICKIRSTCFEETVLIGDSTDTTCELFPSLAVSFVVIAMLIKYLSLVRLSLSFFSALLYPNVLTSVSWDPSYFLLQCVQMAHALRRISYATCEPLHAQFSFLAREPRAHFSLQYCHSFITESAEQVSEAWLSPWYFRSLGDMRDDVRRGKKKPQCLNRNYVLGEDVWSILYKI